MARILNYSTIVKEAGEKEFYTEFFEKVFSTLKKYYSETEAKSIFRALKSKRVKIRNMETFCTGRKFPYEPSNDCYASTIDLIDFVQRVILACKEVEATGASRIPLTTFFVQGCAIAKEKNIQENMILTILKVFLTGLCSYKGSNPYLFRIPDLPLAAKIAERFHIDFESKSYCKFVSTFLKACEESVKNKVEPKVEFIHVLKEDYFENIAYYLSELFKTTKTRIKETLEGIKDFTGRENSLIVVRLTPLNKDGIDLEPVLLNLKYIQENCKLRTFGDPDLLTYVLRKGGAPLAFLKHDRIEVIHSFVSELEIDKEFKTSYCEVEVDCSNYYTFEEVAPLAAHAVKLALLKYRMYVDLLSEGFSVGSDVKVVFTNIQNLSTEFVRAAEYFRENVESKYMRHVTFNYYYDPDDCLTKFGFGASKYLRVISDIHADYSKNSYYTFNFGSDFVVNCGDVADDCVTATNWVKANMTRGLIVPGNHMGYVLPFPELNGPQNIDLYGSIVAPENTRTEQLRYCSLKIPADVQLLNNSVYEYNGVVFLCTTLYTNFSLYGEKSKEECAGTAFARINDYRKIYRIKGTYVVDKVERYLPSDTVEYFEKSLKFLKAKLNKYKGKPIVVVSHFAPLPYSLSSGYAHDVLNAYFANDLKDLFNKYNIRLWVHGHVHHCVDYVYRSTRVVACPFGNGNENGFDLPYKYGVRISFEDIKSKKEWTELVKGIEVKG